MDEALSVREDILDGLEVSDELLEFQEDGVVVGGGGSSAAVVPRVSLVAVEHGSLVPP